MFDTLTTTHLSSEAVQYANNLAEELKMTNTKEVLERSIDRLTTIWKQETDNINWMFDQLTSRNFGATECQTLTDKLNKAQVEQSKLTFKISHLLNLLAEEN